MFTMFTLVERVLPIASRPAPDGSDDTDDLKEPGWIERGERWHIHCAV